MTPKPRITLTLLAMTLLAGAGCNSSQYDKDAYDFDPQRSRTRAVLDAQYAKGAAEDAALTEQHFDDVALNGLGRDKLGWMLAYRQPGDPLVVHVDIPNTNSQAAALRLEAVRDFLTVRGVPALEQTVVIGPSPRSEATAEALAGVRRLNQRNTAPLGAGSATGNVVASQNEGVFSGQ
jgi:hypothetical protein